MELHCQLFILRLLRFGAILPEPSPPWSGRSVWL
jgi:hypothetical protein